MKKIFFALIVIFHSLHSNSQEQNNLDLCFKKKKINSENRLKIYPFNVASLIKFVSFKNLETQDGETFYYSHSIPKLNGKIDVEKLLEIKAANVSEIDSLTNILFNYGLKRKSNTIEPVGCYEPRNAILFYNSSGEVFEYIEICFQCRQMYYGNNKTDIVENCWLKLDLIKEIFLKSGIKFGITEK